MKHLAWWWVSLLAVPAACSVANAPDDPFVADDGADGGSGAIGGAGGSGGQPECVGNDECAALADECNEGACIGGVCEAVPLADGTECGDSSATPCDAPDTCVAGVCDANLALLGTPCGECPAGPGQCAGCQEGACVDCGTFAGEQTFIHESALDGWELTGGWRLYQEAPRNQTNVEPVDLPGLVFGVDGVRAEPYPGSEVENSYARTKTTILPATLQFMSWHVDEGTIDMKSIRLSTDGGVTWTTVAQCGGGGPGGFPFCNFVGDGRPAEQWDPISIPVPAAMVGQPGIVEFTYNSQDSCCSFERGWYLKGLNFATSCACADSTACGWAASECATATCHSSGECRLTSTGEGSACGEGADSDCDGADSCDADGYCRDRVASNGASCFDCMGGVDDCKSCLLGLCESCMNLAPLNTFDSSADITGWQRNGGWNRYTSAPVSSTFTFAVTFPSPVFGTDGNRVPPYPGSETETSFARTLPFVVPNQITFESWHVDEGGNAMNPFDRKAIRLSMDDGNTWVPIVDCSMAGLDAYPFCSYFNQSRTALQWDSIVVDTSAHAGEVAIMEFAYDTVDSGGGSFERGWYIDDLNVARRCLD